MPEPGGAEDQGDGWRVWRVWVALELERRQREVSEPECRQEEAGQREDLERARLTVLGPSLPFL